MRGEHHYGAYLFGKMDLLYKNGLEIIKENQEAIKEEWRIIVQQYKRNHIKIGTSMEKPCT